VLLTWRRRPGPWLAASAGLLLGLAVTVRFVGEAALVPAVLFVVLAAGPTWRRRMKVTAAFAVACAMPLVSYAVYTHSFTGTYSLQASNNGMLYGRTATIADCASLPADLEPLCPSGSAAYRDSLGPDFYTSTSASPFFTSGDARQANPFSDYVIKHQPLAFAEAVGHDFLQLFLSPHDDVNDGTAVSRWQFQTTYPQFPPPLSVTTELATYGHSAPSVNVGVAQVLRDYQLGGGYTPDVLYAVFLLAGLGGALGLTRSARRSGLRLKCALWTGTGVILLLGADVFLFSWRYQLPALITLPIGGAFGIAALLGSGKMWPPMHAYPEPSDEAAVAQFRERYGADFELPTNRGQSAALRVGYHLAYESGAQYIVTNDADGQYSADELPDLLKPILDEPADLTIGSRVLGKRENRDLVRHAGVRFFAFIVTHLTGTKVTDTSSGYRAMRAQVPVSITLTQAQYQTSEFLIGALAKGYRVADVPVTMHLRGHGTTKKGNNLVFGTRYTRVVLGTWCREWMWGRRGWAGARSVNGLLSKDML
jgi:hypothetical protein